MQCHVIIATKGRAAETCVLMGWLARQDRPADSITVVGVTAQDVAGVAEAQPGLPVSMVLAEAGLTRQRNAGIDALARHLASDADALVVFFDDDYRPHAGWLGAALAVASAPDIAGIDGTVLADGAPQAAITEAQAAAIIAAAPPQHGAPVPARSLYGCNFAIRWQVFAHERFEEALPLYGWLEDKDFTVRAGRYGRLVTAPGCLGVHLGVKGARVNGRQYGYSQIANPCFMVGKGTMRVGQAGYFIARALVSNALRSVRGHPLFDYRGRLAGNFMALADGLRARMDPRRITQFNARG